MSVNVDTAALIHNALLLKERIGDFYSVLKCNAYGHGTVCCAKALSEIGIRRYAVFSLDEALEIHPYVENSEILILGRTDVSGISVLSEKGFIQTVFSEEYAQALSAFGEKLKLHIKVDTGMNRSGFPPDSERIFSALGNRRKEISGVYTHFPCADAVSLSDTEKRLSVFLNTASELEELLKNRLTKHAAASAAAARLPSARLDLCRIGLMLYGALPSNTELSGLRPVMSLFGKITGVRTVKKGETVGYGCAYLCQRDSVIATVDCGYASGVRRNLAGRFTPKLNGFSVPLAAVCMDRSMLDVTEITENGTSVKVGDTVTFFGDGYSVDNMARAAGTISYEILTSADTLPHGLREGNPLPYK